MHIQKHALLVFAALVVAGFQNCSEPLKADVAPKKSLSSVAPSPTATPFLPTASPTPSPTPSATPTATPVGAARIIDTTFASLANYHSGCSSSDPSGAGCRAGASRLCAAQLGSTGFGAVQAIGESAQIACVSGSQSLAIATNFSVLATYHLGCDSSLNANHGVCMAATNRFCRASGYGGGMGVVEYNGVDATVHCFSTSAVTGVVSTLAALNATGESCSLENATSLTCMSASQKYCSSLNFKAGAGLVEYNSTDVVVNCLK